MSSSEFSRARRKPLSPSLWSDPAGYACCCSIGRFRCGSAQRIHPGTRRVNPVFWTRYRSATNALRQRESPNVRKPFIKKGLLSTGRPPFPVHYHFPYGNPADHPRHPRNVLHGDLRTAHRRLEPRAAPEGIPIPMPQFVYTSPTVLQSVGSRTLSLDASRRSDLSWSLPGCCRYPMYSTSW